MYSERYDHLKLSISNLESPIRQILMIAKNSNELANSGQDEVKGQLAEETTQEIYVSNLDRSVTPGS